MRIKRRWTVLLLTTVAFPAGAAPQTDFYCEAKLWTKNEIATGYQRPRDQEDDNFRLRIVGKNRLRITGSDWFSNGEHTFVRSGGKYIFQGMASASNGLGREISLSGKTSFDPATGRLVQYGTAQLLVEWTYQWEASCE